MLTSLKLALDWMVTILLLAMVSACIGYCVGKTIDAIIKAWREWRPSNVQ